MELERKFIDRVNNLENSLPKALIRLFIVDELIGKNCEFSE